MTEDESRWITAWRYAGPELERIRNEELRQLDEMAGLRSLVNQNQPSGLEIFQQWMMRWRILDSIAEERANEGIRHDTTGALARGGRAAAVS
jgi:hypothetical protein